MKLETTGLHLRDARERMGLSPSELARVLCINPATVHRWETAEANMVKVDGFAAVVMAQVLRRHPGRVAATVRDALLTGHPLDPARALLAAL